MSFAMSIRRELALRLVVLTVGLVASTTVTTAQVPNEPRNMASTSRAQAERTLDSYFAAMNSHDFSDVPFTHEVTFRGSLHTEPVKGDSAVRAFLVAVAKGAQRVELKWRVIDSDRACAHYEYQSNEGAVVPAVTCFRFEAGRIAEERAFFDPRPFLTPPSGKDSCSPASSGAARRTHKCCEL